MVPVLGFPVLSGKAEVELSPATPPSRWSHTNVSSPPYASVVPATEDDIRLVLEYAHANSLKVLPIAGKHGSFIPINDRTIYLDLCLFDELSLDQESKSVTLGGGVTVGLITDYLAQHGWYTSCPNSNAIGMAGYIIGGGSSTTLGLHGLAIDHLLSVRLITASGNMLNLSPTSPPAERELFNVLCGAGFGFGVITSITLRAWSLASLDLAEPQTQSVWTRRLLFPASAIEIAAELFIQLESPPPELSVLLFCLRAPPSAPNAGTPLVMLSLTYFGSTADAEAACSLSFSGKYTFKTFSATTQLMPWASLNAVAEPVNRHGDYKENYSLWHTALSTSQITRAFTAWNENLPSAAPSAKAASYFLLSAKNPTAMLAHDPDEKLFFPRAVRACGIFAQEVPWWTDPADEDPARKWAEDMLEVLGEGMESRQRGFAANMYKGVDVKSIWTEDQIEEIRRLKGKWDEGNVFWNPVVDGV